MKQSDLLAGPDQIFPYALRFAVQNAVASPLRGCLDPFLRQGVSACRRGPRAFSPDGVFGKHTAGGAALGDSSADIRIDFAYVFVISTSIVIVISSPTKPERALTPKSCRLTLVVADAPMRCPLPIGSLIGSVGPSTSSTTSLVTP
jgi:hypothetical protein